MSIKNICSRLRIGSVNESIYKREKERIKILTVEDYIGRPVITALISYYELTSR